MLCLMAMVFATFAASSAVLDEETIPIARLPNLRSLTLEDNSPEEEKCNENKKQNPCKGKITIHFKNPKGCNDVIKARYNFLPIYICLKCDGKDELKKDEDNCPYVTCAGVPLCGKVEVLGVKRHLTPKQMKCVYLKKKYNGCL